MSACRRNTDVNSLRYSSSHLPITGGVQVRYLPRETLRVLPPGGCGLADPSVAGSCTEVCRRKEQRIRCVSTKFIQGHPCFKDMSCVLRILALYGRRRECLGDVAHIRATLQIFGTRVAAFGNAVSHASKRKDIVHPNWFLHVPDG